MIKKVSDSDFEIVKDTKNKSILDGFNIPLKDELI